MHTATPLISLVCVFSPRLSLTPPLCLGPQVGDALEATYKGVKDFKWHRAQASPNWALLEDKAKAPGTPRVLLVHCSFYCRHPGTRARTLVCLESVLCASSS